MKIKKMYQGTVPENKILNTKSDSQTDVYSCDYINNMIEDSGWIDLIFPDTSLFQQYNTFQTCQYRKIGDILYFRGLIKVVTSNSQSTDVICEMQNNDFAPSIDRYVTLATAGAEPNFGGYPLNVIITSDGKLKVNYSKVQSWISLDGISIAL